MGIGGIESSVVSSTSSARTTATSSSAAAQSVQSIDTSQATYFRVEESGATDRQDNNSNQNNPNTKDGSVDNLNADVENQIQDVSPEKIQSAIKEINDKIKPTHTECQFSYHERTRRISIKVIDQASGEIIREIPPEKTLDMIAKMWEMEGILVDEKR